jgi:hypothetical protein
MIRANAIGGRGESERTDDRLDGLVRLRLELTRYTIQVTFKVPIWSFGRDVEQVLSRATRKEGKVSLGSSCLDPLPSGHHSQPTLLSPATSLTESSDGRL